MLIGNTGQQLLILDYHFIRYFLSTVSVHQPFLKYTSTVTKRSTLRLSSAAEFLLVYALGTMVNSKVHSLGRARRCSGLRAVTVLQWWPKSYQVDGVAKLQPSVATCI